MKTLDMPLAHEKADREAVETNKAVIDDTRDIKVADIRKLNTSGDANKETLPNLELVDNKNESAITPGETSTVKLNVDGKEREFQIFVPEGKKGPMPVVYAFHGLVHEDTDDPRGLMERETELNKYARERGFIVVYPIAQNGEDGYFSWNSKGAGLTATDPSYDDVDYMKKVVSTVHNELGLDIDKKDQILVGFSEGGEFIHHLAGAMPGVFTDRASVHGTLIGTELDPKEPMPTVLIHGGQDYMLPFSGGSGFMSDLADFATGGLDKIDDSKPVDLYRKALIANNCTEEDQKWEHGPDSESTTMTWVNDAKCDAPVYYHFLTGAQHAWHGVGEGGFPFVGEKDEKFNATEEILNRLLGH